MLTEHHFNSKEDLFRDLLEFCVQALRSDLAESDAVSCFLSGGTTPAPLYEQLAQTDLPWQRIHPALVDERWVDTRGPDSNENLLRRCFNANPDFVANLVGMHVPGKSALQAEVTCNSRYATLPRPGSFCLLGMGLDGHVASLFPGATGLAEALSTTASCKAITARQSTVTGRHVERMSLTLSALLDCRRILLLFTGTDKWQVYQQALTCKDAETFPVSAVLQQSTTPVHIFHCSQS
jgi:6-phosphogluconolactonase